MSELCEPKYPNITVKLLGEDGNAFAILGRVRRALQSAGISQEEWEQFRDDAMSGDYDHLLQTVKNWVVAE